MGTADGAPPVSFTAAAAEEVRRKRAEHAIPAEKVFRVAVRGGGCSGLVYDLEFAEPKPDDLTVMVGDIMVAVDRASIPYLAGTEIDYSNDLQSGGFKMKNPNSKSSCGCNGSFTT